MPDWQLNFCDIFEVKETSRRKKKKFNMSGNDMHDEDQVPDMDHVQPGARNDDYVSETSVYYSTTVR